MSEIPVYVQFPCKPETNRLVGMADETWEPEDVAREVGVPDDCFLEGKVMRRKGDKHWSLVAYVRFRERK